MMKEKTVIKEKLLEPEIEIVQLYFEDIITNSDEVPRDPVEEGE